VLTGGGRPLALSILLEKESSYNIPGGDGGYSYSIFFLYKDPT
jgi:hypothetical protein